MSLLMTVRQVAHELCVTPKRVYQLIAAGRLDSIKLSPRATRILRASVERYLAECLTKQRRELGLDIAPAKPERRRL